MQHLTASEAAVLCAVARRVVPEVAEMDADGRARFEVIVDHALGLRSAAVRRQIAVFLGVVRIAPVVRWGRTFERLSPERQDAWLRVLQDGPVTLLKQGFWGLKALVFMGYYGQEEVASTIGYAPVFDALGRLDAGA